jgi:hypothetical protein
MQPLGYDRRNGAGPAFDKVVKGQDLIEDAASKNIELDPKPGIEVQKISDAIIDAPPEVIKMAAEAMK